MAEERVQRRLAAIFAADVAGYSRLMEQDEEGTLAALNAHRAELIEPCITEYRGRLVKTTGDGLLAEFGSVVDAVRCAVAFQEGMAERNANVPEDRRIEFRIGVNLGDVIVQDDDVFGDGVNVAARLEGLAEPGSLVVSGMVQEAVRTKLDIGFDDLGLQVVKNIAEPVHAFKAQIFTAQNTARHGIDAVPPPDKLSIAVLPFDNMSSDPEQAYFSDGISEDVITDLSKISGLQVIARNSSFVYRGKAVSVPEVARKLGVRYVLEGSVRKAGNRVRVTAQLIEAKTGAHVWGERYDRDLTDIFAVQDELTAEIVSALKLKLSDEERQRLIRKIPRNVAAYEYFLRGREQVLTLARTGNIQGRTFLQRAIESDAGFTPAYSYLALTHVSDYINGWSDSAEQDLELGFELAQRAASMDEAEPHVHLVLCIANLWMRKHDKAIAEAKRCLELEPNFADAYAALGQIYTYAGKPADAIEPLQTAMRLDPHYHDVYLHFLGQAYFVSGQYEAAIETLRRRLIRRPETDTTRVFLSASYGHLDLTEQARQQWVEALEINPNYSLDDRRRVLPFKDPADFEKIIDGLRKAGLPE